MSTAGHVQVAVDGSGKEIDAQTLTTLEDGVSTVFRQTVTLGDGGTYGNIATIDSHGHVYVRADKLADVMSEMLAQLKLISWCLRIIGGVDLDEGDI